MVIILQGCSNGGLEIIEFYNINNNVWNEIAKQLIF